MKTRFAIFLFPVEFVVLMLCFQDFFEQLSLTGLAASPVWISLLVVEDLFRTSRSQTDIFLDVFTTSVSFKKIISLKLKDFGVEFLWL